MTSVPLPLRSLELRPPAPRATIPSFDASPLSPVASEELDPAWLYRDFIEAPERYLRHPGG